METLKLLPHFTYGGPELFVLFFAFIVSPLIYGLVLKKQKKVIKLSAVFVMIIGSILLAYTDVYFITKEAMRLCREEAGLHVYKTVEAEGFLGSGVDISYWSQYGFAYVEGIHKGNKIRSTKRNGEIFEEKISNFISEYELGYDSKAIHMTFVQNTQVIRNRENGDLLGELISFSVYPGWLDSRVLGFLGFSFTPLTCDSDYLPQKGQRKFNYRNLMKAVIKPKIK